ncbi:hypothetical protein Rsub_12845 [Raphidocelis subcapitata]|uniref:Uncharacterized protein n=1 Tax=Raphidocelis subcapitata TaxID=307507 RepID=A0A2V0PPK4_9CHLO|nr:hypothetical protein Rsub_12845 [Raphidocelis subcapitata]|eukprot:GBG00104.1 hypothetical protein Rsub_12845 [Raphidocelis subcapitata]
MQYRNVLPSQRPETPAAAGRAATQRQRRRRPNLVALALALLFWAALGSYAVRWRARSHIAGGAACKARLERLGVDLGAAASGVDDARAGAAPTARRHRAYASMAATLASGGLRLGGEITQGLTQGDLFEVLPPDHPDRGRPQTRPGSAEPLVAPRLRPLAVPVRAVVLPLLDRRASNEVHEAAAARLAEILGAGSVWWQDPGLFHATLYHASTHGVRCGAIAPVPADAAAVEAEAAAVARVAQSTCPVRAVLERVAATAGGVLVACWQVLPGSGEPEDIRASLRHALPHAPPPAQQAVREPAMLHTTVARLLSPARRPAAARRRGRGGEEVGAEALAGELARAAEALTSELCGLEAFFDEMWFVEERDLLALALGGSYVKRASLMRCRGAQQQGQPGGPEPGARLRRR